MCPRLCRSSFPPLAVAAILLFTGAPESAWCAEPPAPVVDIFLEKDATLCEATVPIYNDDAQEAHARAIAAVFAQALRTLPETTASGREADRPERLVTAYRIVDQKRRDLEYSLSALVWTTLPARRAP
jgi:hypothetical protein